MSKLKFGRVQDLTSALFAFFFTATIAVAIQLHKSGWPDNHEGNSFFTRTTLYAEHFKKLDFFPIWSSIDNAGMGSPQPLLYHKFFYYISGAIYVVSDSLKFSVGLTITILLAIGALGIYAILRQLEVNKLAALLGGLFFQFASYTTIVWIYRGAVAEFAFACLVPWFLLSSLSLLRAPADFSIRKCASFGILLSLLFYAHSSCTLALMVFWIPAMCATTLLDDSFESSKNRIINFVIGGSFAVVFLLPFIIPMLIIGSRFGTSRITPSYLLPKNQMRPWFEYINDSKFSWGEKFPTFTISFDRGVVLIALIALVILFKRRSSEGRFFRRNSPTENQSAVQFLGLLLLFTILSQFPIFSFIYEIPGMSFLQFPWRLITVITPLVILLSIKVITHYQPHNNRKVAHLMIGLCLAATMATGGGFVTTKWQRIDIQPTQLTDLHFGFSLFGEYFPKAVTELPYQSAVLLSNEPNCVTSRIGPTSESLSWMFRVECITASNVTLPVIASNHHIIDLIWETSQSKNRCRKSNYLCEVSVPAGLTHLVISPPTLLGFWIDFFRS